VSRLSAALARLQLGPNRVIAFLLRAGLMNVLGWLGRLVGSLRGVWITLIAGRYDVVYICKVSSDRFVRRLRRRTQARLVYDLNDAVWLPSWKRYAKGIGEILASVDAVTCDSPHGAAFARQYNDRSFVVPDPSQVELFDRQRAQPRSHRGGIVLGWIGSPSSVCNLYAIWEPLERLFAKHDDLHLRLVGVGYDRTLLPRFERVRWSQLPYYSRDQMISEVLGMDIGLYPLFDVEESLARGILKATIYMSGGVAVVCSNVGQCRELVADGVNGMLAGSGEEWLAKLERLVADGDLRRSVAQRGLDTVRQEYNLERCFGRLLQALTDGERQ